MKANQATWPIATMARLLEVSSSGFYAWLKRKPSAHALGDADLLARMRAIFARSRGTYGMPRIYAEFVEQGIHIARKRVRRLMPGRSPKLLRVWSLQTPPPCGPS